MDSSISYNDDEHIESHLTQSQALELAYRETLLKTDLVLKDEGARRLRLRILLLEGENDDLHEQLALADDRIDVLEQVGEELRAQLDETQEDARRHETESRTQNRELNNLKAELVSMTGVTMDSAKVLAEKLALTRELATLKPELEHLRSQAAYQQTVLAEKLALERQVSTLEVELETEKRASKRALEKYKNKDRELEMQQQLDDLQNDLLREKKEREKESKEASKQIETEKRAVMRAVEKGNDNQKEVELEQQLKDLRKELEREKRERANDLKEAEKDLEVERKAAKRTAEKGSNRERELELQDQIEDLRRDLSREKREAGKARKEAEMELETEKRAWKRAAEKANNVTEKDQELQDQLNDLQKDLAKERREKEKARKEADKELKASETQKEVLESKLEQIKTKLRSVKQELKESQTQLAQARTATAKVGDSRTDPAKNPRKRSAVDMSTYDAIGTPDGVAARKRGPAVKRGRTDQTILGEKSMFSITPFLNKTVNMAPDTPAEEEIQENVDAKVSRVNQEQDEEIALQDPLEKAAVSPSAPPKPKAKRKPIEENATAERKVLGAAKNGLNAKKPAAKKPRAVSTLENVVEEEADENEEPTAPAPAKVDAARLEPPKPLKQLKNTEDAQAQKKKRKLLGGGTTLFDEEDGEAKKRPAKVKLGQPRPLGKGGLAGPKGGLKGGLGAGSGFGSFSPLKKDRRGVGASFLAH